MTMRILFAVPAAALSCLLAGCGARSELYSPAEGGGVAPVPTATGAPAPTSSTTEPVSCVEMGVTYIYVVAENEALYRFDPTNASFKRIGTIACHDPLTPNSMAVDRSGTAYVSYQSGNLYAVDVGTAACASTPYVPNQLGWTTFGMGYSADATGGGETLYVAQSNFQNPSEGLGRIDTVSFELSFVGSFSDDLGSAVELTGTGDGRLFALSVSQADETSTIVELDPSTATTMEEIPFLNGQPIEAFAFAFWGGDFYAFTTLTDESMTRVHRYRPADSSLVQVATLGDSIVGAGVSTCAPH